MRVDQLSSFAAGSARSSSARGVSRRAFLQAGAAAGGGLLLSLRLPFANGEADAAGALASRPTPSSASAATGRLS
jgi:isoquinoline 1-oxidoreductase beta subunit